MIEFVAETLRQIINGVVEAQGYAAEKGGHVNPQGQSIIKGDLVAYGRCVQNDNEIYWSEVEVASAADGCVCARGTVLYRIMT